MSSISYFGQLAGKINNDRFLQKRGKIPDKEFFIKSEIPWR